MSRENATNIYEQLYTPIYRYFFGRTLNKELSLDLTQDVFLKVYRHLKGGESLENLPRSYFFTIARNTLIDEWRRKKSTNLSEEQLENLPGGERGDKLALDRETKEVVDRALSRLDEDAREIISWRYLAGLSNAEIAELTGRSEDALRQIQSRALRSLREEFKRYGE